MGKKYRLTDETIMYGDRTLHRIEALRDFNDVEIGQRGGFVESEHNLSQAGNCWIYGNAKVFDNARVYEHACVFDNAQVYGDAEVRGRAHIFDNAMIYDSAYVMMCAKINHNSRVHGISLVCDSVCIIGDSDIHGNAIVSGRADIYDAEISRMDDYIVFKNWWSSGRYFTWTRSNNMWKVGCFYGTGEELIAKAYKDSEISGREYERIVRYVESINNPARSVKRLNRIQRIVCKLFRIK